jgi:hypothetical protein
MNVEELKTTIGCLLKDIRGNWAWNYQERLKELLKLLYQLRAFRNK